MSEPILKVLQLTKHFPINGGSIFSKSTGINQAVAGISFELMPGETLGLVGESGCGKSTAGRTIMKLYEPTSGSIIFQGQDITNFRRRELKPIRTQLQMIFQDPYSSLNPRHTVGEIISTPFMIHQGSSRNQVKTQVQDLMVRVGLNPEHYNRYPNEFSGGQRQRIGIARALALKPKLVICDEPVSALDVSIQAQVLNLLQDLKQDFELSYIFIAHDLSVVRHVSDRVAVMYLGKIVELAETEEIFRLPQHPYTQALLSAIPIPDPAAERAREQIILKGDLPSPTNPPTGCVFNTRCWKAKDICRSTEPLLRIVDKTEVACHFPTAEVGN